MSFTLRPATDSDRLFIRNFEREHWGDEMMIDRDRVYYPAEHLAFLAEADDQIVGLVTYRFENGECEIMSFDSLREGQGIGTALMKAVIDSARQHACRRVWLITTNDSVQALRFYQKRGLQIIAVYPYAVDEARKQKPSIPLIADNGIPIRDELELELRLTQDS